LAATFVGAALALGAAAAFGVDFLPPPNMAGSAERTAVRITTAEAGATKASVLWRQKRPGERKTCVRYNTEACMRRTDRRAYWCFTAAAPRYTSIHNKNAAQMQRKSMWWRRGQGWTYGRAPCEERDESEDPVHHD
jgi:hypothetical protein